MTMKIMIQGSMSNVGKSLIVAGLCRLFKQDGYTVAPFKSQNMALNGYVTHEGLELGRAQALQAQAAGITPSEHMNPILLKPTGMKSSDVIVQGKSIGQMSALEFYKKKKDLLPIAIESYDLLAQSHEIIVIEGAGSPSEINLKENDIANMGIAQAVDAPVLIVGDINPGGIFAQLYGTLMLLDKDEQERVKGFIINKFRGDDALLRNQSLEITEKIMRPILGIVPMLDLDLEGEDSLSQRATCNTSLIDIAVIRSDFMTNESDLSSLHHNPNSEVRFVDSAESLGNPDLIVIPGFSDPVETLAWIQGTGLGRALSAQLKRGAAFACIGEGSLIASQSFEWTDLCTYKGLGLSANHYVIELKGVFPKEVIIPDNTSDTFMFLKSKKFKPYRAMNSYKLAEEYNDGNNSEVVVDATVLSSTVHGIFDSKVITDILVDKLVEQKGLNALPNTGKDVFTLQDEQLDILADALRESLDIEHIYSILRESE